jgi:hypothetical protein
MLSEPSSIELLPLRSSAVLVSGLLLKRPLQLTKSWNHVNKPYHNNISLRLMVIAALLSMIAALTIS